MNTYTITSTVSGHDGNMMGQPNREQVAERDLDETLLQLAEQARDGETWTMNISVVKNKA